jgi:ArsR family transcriptional regulator
MTQTSKRSSRMQSQTTRTRDMTMDPDLLFKALADTTRLRMLMLLVMEGELCVCELTHALDEIQPKISRHLAQLRESGVVQDRRQGQWIYYRINPNLPEWAREVLSGLVYQTQGLTGCLWWSVGFVMAAALLSFKLPEVEPPPEPGMQAASV